ncbi:hypothetical protein BRC99_06745 [Halobacteriales archaeon QS_7_69_60]|nr:MAG: hypothetical protein BRC99_06745 [Halobacteriales archaeon QS_7_69_60]
MRTRRQFVATIAALPVVGAAGCPDGSPGEGADESPRPYARWLPASPPDDSADAVMYVHEDWSDGPLGGNELEVFGAYPFYTDLRSGPDDATDVGETTAVLRVAAATVYRGSYDLEELTGRADNFEEVDTREEFTLYERPAEADDDRDTPTPGPDEPDVGALAFAAGESAVVVPEVTVEDPLGRIEALLDVRHGEAERIWEADADAGWALSTVGGRNVSVGGWTDRGGEGDAGERPYQVPETVRDIGPTTAEIYAIGGDGSEVTSRLAATYREGERPPGEEIEPAAGHTADERDVETTESRLEVTATWRAEADGA